MRDYLLYLKQGKMSIQAYVTPCFEVDLMYWRDREGCQLHIMGKSPSLALVFSLREMINTHLQGLSGTGKSITDKALANLKQMITGYVHDVSHLYKREATGIESPGKEWFEWEESDHPSQEYGNSVDGIGECTGNSPSATYAQVLAGRSLLWEEVGTLLQKRGMADQDCTAVLQQMVLAGKAEWKPGIRLSMKKGWWRNRLELKCERCGSGSGDLELTVCHSCGQGCAYCTVCLGMGRSKCCTPYVLVSAPKVVSAVNKREQVRDVARLQWMGSYSKDQARAAEQARRFVASPRLGLDEFLIWAVCGAGKTELLFPSIAEALSAGGRVLIATPRKDVVLELAPRIQKVFPNARVIAVHGSSAQKWDDSDITIATTHQVMRYYRRFPLVVLDEADAFPYHNNLVLYRAVARAVQAGGKLLYLSATPPRYLQKRLIPSKRSFFIRTSSRTPLLSASHVLLPGRYHGSVLPVPDVVTVQGLHKRVQSNRPIAPLVEMVRSSLDNGRQVFLFVPRIDDVEKVLAYVQQLLPAHAPQMAGVHAADTLREEKVRAFRDRQYTLMVTTTILERGVTIPRSDVVVLGAEAPVFDEASLVQIAGRVGRSIDDTTGTVLFLQADRANAPKAAVKQICRMNQLAQKLRAQEERN
ncbi:DEAD/DEAH box helicase [uncultured Brevibacillus sp.]|uniref:DEAD/DEAH box helicase n=1 Tax=uncultured Brevibacillus sp. TaxID=169970 RepID=UPI0025944B72|nr:helicase-related protein [uncultured Brevibacillus sp.]